MPLRIQLEARSVKIYAQGLISINDIFSFLMRSATYILFKYKISPYKIYQSTYASVAKCIAVMYDKNVSDGDWQDSG